MGIIKTRDPGFKNRGTKYILDLEMFKQRQRQKGGRKHQSQQRWQRLRRPWCQKLEYDRVPTWESGPRKKGSRRTGKRGNPNPLSLSVVHYSRNSKFSYSNLNSLVPLRSGSTWFYEIKNVVTLCRGSLDLPNVVLVIKNDFYVLPTSTDRGSNLFFKDILLTIRVPSPVLTSSGTR